jgi:hypothetical protein
MSAPQALDPLSRHPDAMRKFDVLTGVAAPLLRANVDTDAIIPSREMKSVSKHGLADGLFAGWRYLAIGGREPNNEFVLNQRPTPARASCSRARISAAARAASTRSGRSTSTASAP